MNNYIENPKHKYELQKKIGSGSYGNVFKARIKNQKNEVAIKVIDVTSQKKSDIEQVLNEIRILSSITSPFIIGYYEAFINPPETEFWIIMEYMNGGDLQRRIQKAKRERVRISESEIWRYFVQILLGIKDLNQKNIIHRDIKPANIFISKDTKKCKIGDMNVSKIVKNCFTSTQIGTPYYLPPEMWQKKDYDVKCDVFSLGCLIYELATLKHPFEATSVNELSKKVTKKKTPDLPIFYSKELNLIVKKCLTKNPENRPSAEDLFSNNIFRQKLISHGLNEYLNVFNQIYDDSELVDTINMPNQLSDLNKFLPQKLHKDHQRANSMGDNLPDISQLDTQGYIIEKQFHSKQLTPKIAKHNNIREQNYKSDNIDKKQIDIIVRQMQNDQQFKKSPPVKIKFGKKQKPQVDFVSKNKQMLKRNSSNKSKRNSSNQRQQSNSRKSIKRVKTQVSDSDKTQKKNIQKKRVSSKNVSIKYISNSRNGSIKRKSSKNISIKRKSSRNTSINRDMSRNGSVKRQSSKNGSIKKISSKILPRKKSSSLYRKNSREKNYKSNNFVNQVHSKQNFASQTKTKNPPVRSIKQNLPPPKTPQHYNSSNRKKSKSLNRIKRTDSQSKNSRNQKAIKYGEFMKQVSSKQRQKSKNRRSSKSIKRKTSLRNSPNKQKKIKIYFKGVLNYKFIIFFIQNF